MRIICLMMTVIITFSCGRINETENQISLDTTADTISNSDETVFSDSSGDEISEESMSVLQVLAAEYPNLYKLTSKLAEAMISHNENDIIKLCDQENYETQKDIGISDYQYVYEILNITGEEIADDENYKKYSKKVFKEIEKVEFTSFDPVSGESNDEYYLFGIIINKSGDTLNFNFVTVLEEGEYRITGAVG